MPSQSLNKNLKPPLPVPSFFNEQRVGEIWKVPYQERAGQARLWAKEYQLAPATRDEFRVALIAVDIQNTFCLPGFELFVGGRSGMGAVEDNRRLAAFIYRNLGNITQFMVTLDTHQAMQIFHPIMLVDAGGNHPDPLTTIRQEDVESGRWRFNPSLANMLGFSDEYGQQHLLHYTRELQRRHKYDLMIWPYHAMLGGIGHALVASIEEAIFFHSVARYSQPEIQIKGQNPLTEHYSAVGPEVLEGPDGSQIAQKDDKFIRKVLDFDAVIIAGQAKSHCVAWTIADLLEDIRQRDEKLAEKVYLLQDCMSPVVVPGVVDYTDPADEEFARFAQAGMRLVSSTEPMDSWLE
ncbi:MAG: isochorismatase [Chloroflexota bacterium]|nr:MAG: isochorismatase [Chloroflexota bacterium]